MSNRIAELVGRKTANQKDVDSSLVLGRSLCKCTCLLQMDKLLFTNTGYNPICSVGITSDYQPEVVVSIPGWWAGRVGGVVTFSTPSVSVSSREVVSYWQSMG